MTLRAKFLLVIAVGVVIPLAVVGFWLARATERSGRALVRARLDGALAQAVTEVGSRWVVARADLLDLAEAPEVLAALAGDATAGAGQRVAVTPRVGTAVGTRAASVLLRATGDRKRWTLTGVDDTTLRLVPAVVATTDDPGIMVSLPVMPRVGPPALGVIETRLAAASLVPPGAGGSAAVGTVLGIANGAGAWLAPLPFDPAFLARDEFDWAGERWLVSRRTLAEPPLLLAAAAPLGAFTAPFESAARRGALALLVVATATLTLAVLLTRRLTHSLEQLAIAADAVSQGDLDRRVDVPDDDEVGRVARAFNAMMESLRHTLGQLARRERAAAIGEFAASLAHEVRNPLTSIRIDLQRVEEQVPPESSLRSPLERALREVSRLDRTVSGALRVARSGTPAMDFVDLRTPLGRALEVTNPAFAAAAATLELPNADGTRLGDTPLIVRGDDSALEQLFLNLLLNAAQSLPPGGRVIVSTAADRDTVEVSIRDTGHGIPPAVMGRIFEPFFSTKKEGTGLGLAVARQVATTHGGNLVIESEPGMGTTARVRLPLLPLDRSGGSAGLPIQ